MDDKVIDLAYVRRIRSDKASLMELVDGSQAALDSLLKTDLANVKLDDLGKFVLSAMTLKSYIALGNTAVQSAIEARLAKNQGQPLVAGEIFETIRSVDPELVSLRAK